jgi:hypothetical protein
MDNENIISLDAVQIARDLLQFVGNGAEDSKQEDSPAH